MTVWKILQRQFYDILSNKCFLFLFVLLAYSILISILHFCEVWLNGNLPFKSKMNVNDFDNNIGRKTLQDRLCQYFPIDVVYTWVNGSDTNFLSQLRLEERRVRKELSLTCSLADCLPSHFTTFRMGVSELQEILNNLSYMTVKSVKVGDKDWTIMRWDSVKTAEEQSDKVYDVNHRYTVPVFHVHWTTDMNAPNLYLPGNTVAIRGVNKSLESVTYNLESLLDQSFGQLQIASIWRYPKIIFVELNSQSDVQQILKGKKWNIIFIKHVMKLNVTRAGLILEIPSTIQPDDYSPSRYEDKEELRYSLRSLEKYAPWVRKIYIVTNGQLPHWLDLSNPRVQIVTHESIFINSSHLPTFSSAAIETHLHRIPGISEKFLYFNDDIFLGEEVLPEDFITSRGGQKVYLSWPVPDCSAVCPWSWVGDGTCDVPCNTTTCDYDGADCLSPQTSDPHFHADFTAESGNGWKHRTNKTSQDYEEQSTPETIKNLVDYSKDNVYAINTDDDLNKLMESLAANNTKFTSEVIHDMFLFLKTLHINNQTHGKPADESFYKKSILFEKLREYSKFSIKSNVYGETKAHKSVKRNILSVEHADMDGGSPIKSDVKTVLQYVNPNINRMNLSRAQVGVPPIGVAERFYAYQPEIASLRQKLDTFAESLLYVNSLLNQRYGYKARKVPSHMPHLIDKNIMNSLQTVFSLEYEKTSSHSFRHPQDMQFSFGYFYFLMNEEFDVPVANIFDMFDTDESGTWSDREVRTVLTRLYDLPLQRSSVLNFETALLYCARGLPHYQFTTPPFERYIDSKLPLVTKSLIENCTLVSDLLKLKMGRKKRYLYNPVKPATRETVVGFHMITSNLSQLLFTLDKIRRKPKKFICLNDNMDANREEDNQLIRAVLIDFFHSLFPKPSQFELPSDYRNRYLYYNDFVVWQSKKKKLSRLLYAAIGIAIIITFYCLLRNECKRMTIRIMKRIRHLIMRMKTSKKKLPIKL